MAVHWQLEQNQVCYAIIPLPTRGKMVVGCWRYAKQCVCGLLCVVCHWCQNGCNGHGGVVVGWGSSVVFVMIASERAGAIVS